MRFLDNLRSKQTDDDLLRQTTALTTAYLLERNRSFEAWLRRKIVQLEEYVTAQEMHEQELAGELDPAMETISDEAGVLGWDWASSLDDRAVAGDDEVGPVEAGQSMTLSESIPDWPDEDDITLDAADTIPVQSIEIEPAEPDTAQDDDEAGVSVDEMDRTDHMDWQGWLLGGSATTPAVANDPSVEADDVEAIDEPDLVVALPTKPSDPLDVVEMAETPASLAVTEPDVVEEAIVEETAGQVEITSPEPVTADEAGQSDTRPVLSQRGQAIEMEQPEVVAEPVEYFSLDALPELAAPLEPAGDDTRLTTEADKTDPDNELPGEYQADEGEPVVEETLDPWESDLDYEGGLPEHL